jgi:hypothetical protein
VWAVMAFVLIVCAWVPVISGTRTTWWVGDGASGGEVARRVAGPGSAIIETAGWSATQLEGGRGVEDCIRGKGHAIPGGRVNT